jgi:uroporphyrinogen III methyltransferase/synthase
MTEKAGKVYLVGAGPGDPGLITVRGIELIEQAEVLVYDQLGTAAFVSRCKPDCEMIDVGKFAGNHTVPQEEINEILIRKAKEGKFVVRLKGGDPFVFGRGGEELQKLFEADVEFEIVPGITSAISAPAYAGIPVTHRDFTSTLAIVTGHEADKETSAIDWKAISGIGSIVFLMGVKKLPEIVKRLIDSGRSPQTPVAMIQHGTLPIQRTVCGTLETIVDIAKKNEIKAPAITIVGEVVNLRESMKWFEKRPLFGRTILVTRSRHQASELLTRLRQLGANAIEFPTIRIVQHHRSELMNEFLKQISEYNYLVFTSVNGVNGFCETLLESQQDLRALYGKKIVCIGPATAKAFSDRGILPDFVPETYVAESLIPWFEDRQPGKVAFLRAEKAREVLPEALRKIGYKADVIPVYHTEYESPDADTATALFRAGKIDLVTFTSSSTVDGFEQVMKGSDVAAEKVSAAVIGPITEQTARSKGYNIECSAREYTIPGLIDAMLEYFARKARPGR